MNKLVSTLASMITVIEYHIKRRKLLLLFIMILFTFMSLFRLVRVVGESMEPTLHSSDRCILLINGLVKYRPHRGDIVVFEKRSYGNKCLIKRVIGIPGDLVEIKSNLLYLNGELVNEPFINESMVTSNLVCNVGDDQIFVLGDNRNKSSDSRLPNIGLVNYKTEVLGKVLFNISECLDNVLRYLRS